MAEQISKLKRETEFVRIVAHSIGCLHALQAASLLAESERPSSMHLCAPACSEKEIEDILKKEVAGQTHVYFSSSDYLLSYLYRVQGFGLKKAIGSEGLKENYPGVNLLDVKDHFEFFVHTEYCNRFHRFAALETIKINKNQKQ